MKRQIILLLALVSLSVAAVTTYTHGPTSGTITSVVASLNLTAQTTAISTATLYTSAATGLYRVSGVIETTTAGSAGTVTVTLGWTDAIGATTTVPLNLFTMATTGRSQITPQVIQVNSGEVISYATAVASVIGNPAYTVRLTVEKLF